MSSDWNKPQYEIYHHISKMDIFEILNAHLGGDDAYEVIVEFLAMNSDVEERIKEWLVE